MRDERSTPSGYILNGKVKKIVNSKVVLLVKNKKTITIKTQENHVSSISNEKKSPCLRKEKDMKTKITLERLNHLIIIHS